MDDNAPKENPPADFNKLDLSQLQGFSFGTQWTQEKPSTGDRRDREGGGDRPRREDRRDGPGGMADRRDRRAFRRPAGGPGDQPGAAPANPAAGGPGGDRRPRHEGGGGGEFRGGPRREGGYSGGGDRGPRFQQGGPGGQGGYGGRGSFQERGPYDSPYYSVTFYPEDTSFNTLVQTIRKSCRTVELFEIARTVVAKPDRFVVVIAPKPPGDSGPGGGSRSPAAGEAGAVAAVKPPRPMFHIAVPDGLPFESDEAAVAHVMSRHLDKFFDTAEVEVDPPKGNFQVINRCGITGELLGPPNYHRYNQIVQQHYAAKVASRVGFEAFRSRIETVRDPEVVNQWLAKMKKTTRYTWKLAVPGAQPAVPAVPVVEPTTPAPEGEAVAPVEAQPAPPAEAAAVSTTPTFDTLEDARLYLLTQARDKVARTSETARFHGKVVETIPPGEIRHAIDGALERQRRFPLDTANALRGRLRREHLTIFKKGSKGVSYVCAVKRKFRVPGQTFSDSIGALISYIEGNAMVRAGELPTKFLGIAMVPAPRPAEPAPATEAPAAPEAEAAPAPESPKPEPSLSIDDRARISRLQGDLMWLVREGYVTEFIDGRLFAPPPVVEARKKEIESEDHDPENFPEAPAPEATAPASPEATEPASTEPSAPASAEPAAETEPAAVAESPAVEAPAELPAPTEPATEDKPAAPSAPAAGT